MSPKRPHSESPVDQTPKRRRKVMTLEEKLGVLNKLRGGMSCASVGRHYDVNESTIRTIKKNEQVIRASLQSCAPRSAKQVHHVRDKALTKMEYALFIWIEDQQKKGVAVDTAVIQEKAKSLYERFKSPPDEAGLSTSVATPPSAFQASKGWYANFKRRFFKIVKITGEAASADHEAAKAFPAQFENGCTPEQIWNMDGTGKSKNLHALQRRGKNLLPVFWMHNRKAWMTSDLFLDWFHNCFLCEVVRYLTSMGEEFKVLLTLDNTPDHPQLIEVVLPECVKDFDGFAPNQTVGEAVRKTLALAKKVTAEGFQSLSEDVTELLEEHDVELTGKDVEKLVRSSEEEEQKDDVDEGITLERLGELARHIQAATDLALKMDPSMKRKLKFKRDMAEGFSPYKIVMEEMKKKRKQLPITMFFSREPSATSTQPATTPPSKLCAFEQLTSPPDLHHHPAH